MEKYLQVEHSISKTYRHKIWGNFIRAIKEYDLIQAGDKIAVCMSGGKDSMLLAKCMQLLNRYSEIPFEVVYLVMDPGYNTINRQTIMDNAQLLNVPITVFDSSIYDIVAKEAGSPCYLCARMRRGALYTKAQELGCNKIALGHHFDDVIETTLLSMFYNGKVSTMMPKLHSDNFENMEVIRPLYHVEEKDIIAWRNFNELQFIACACRFTENCSLNESSDSKRLAMKKLIQQLKQEDPNIANNIFKSVYNVSLDTVIGYQKEGIKHHFLDEYDSKKKK